MGQAIIIGMRFDVWSFKFLLVSKFVFYTTVEHLQLLVEKGAPHVWWIIGNTASVKQIHLQDEASNYDITSEKLTDKLSYQYPSDYEIP